MIVVVIVPEKQIKHGDSIKHFSGMEKTIVKFLSLTCIYSHKGLVDEFPMHEVSSDVFLS